MSGSVSAVGRVTAPPTETKPTAPLARAGGGETRFGARLLAKGFSTQSARRLMLIVSTPLAKTVRPKRINQPKGASV